MVARVLIIAGSDSSGGAGIQADIKTVTALGGYAASAVTAVTVQNTCSVSHIHPIPVTVIRDQIAAVVDDIGVDAVKIGMIGDIETGQMIAETLSHRLEDVPIVLDPVLVATSGDSLAGDGVAVMIRNVLTPISTLITPNADEAAALTGLYTSDGSSLADAGRRLCHSGAKAALVKGGHLDGDTVTDVLIDGQSEYRFANPRLAGGPFHGTGCTLASAIATELAKGRALVSSVERGIEFVRRSINSSAGLGHGATPLNHTHTVNETETN